MCKGVGMNKETLYFLEMSSIAKNMGGKILLCDDLSDTGITLEKSIDWIKSMSQSKIKLRKSKQQHFGKRKNQLLNQIIVQ